MNVIDEWIHWIIWLVDRWVDVDYVEAVAIGVIRARRSPRRRRRLQRASSATTTKATGSTLRWSIGTHQRPLSPLNTGVIQLLFNFFLFNFFI